MARAKGEGSVVKLPDGKWRATVRSKGRSASATRKTRREAVDELPALRARLGVRTTTDIVTVGGWLNRWVAASELAYESRRLYERLNTQHLQPRLGDIAMHDLDTATVHRCWQQMRADGVGTATIGRCHAILSAALGEAARQGEVPFNVARDARPPKHTTRTPDPLTPDQARQLLAALRQPDAPSGRILATILLLGLRVGEAIDLRWRHVDPPWLTVPGTKTQGSHAVLPLPHLVADILGDPGSLDAPVFTSRYANRPTSRQTVHRDLQSYCDALGFDRRRVHDLRHTTGSLLASVGVQPRIVQAVLRHKSAAMSVHYSRPHDTALADGLALLGETLQ